MHHLKGWDEALTWLEDFEITREAIGEEIRQILYPEKTLTKEVEEVMEV